MDTTRNSKPRGAGTAPRRRYGPPAAVWGFLALLVAVFLGSYALGATVGPIGREDRPPPSAPPRVTEHVHEGDHS
ncbi:hypothetical protein EAO70_05485 [Streptomyces sp. adm13(2018)]|uniref:hypothetical protein n=1 Tax=Streptomyces sp. adm13(2018) TaxID=2479007 RepID=UPI0011CDFFA5|nr:hypothetical protein [Streptomyces sp. adm13(2018)]TXS22854.1 hypothetical protein EAO70_05485 [Streptomyces sp. adm13(2018)]